jgi:hypothetical protein
MPRSPLWLADLVSDHGGAMKPFRSIRLRIQLIVGLLVTVLVAVSAVAADRAFERRQQAERVVRISEISRDLFAELNLLRLERGTTAGLIASPGEPDQREIEYQGLLRSQSTPRMRAALARLSALSPEGDAFGQIEIAASGVRRSDTPAR